MNQQQAQAPLIAVVVNRTPQGVQAAATYNYDQLADVADPAQRLLMLVTAFKAAYANLSTAFGDALNNPPPA